MLADSCAEAGDQHTLQASVIGGEAGMGSQLLQQHEGNSGGGDSLLAPSLPRRTVVLICGNNRTKRNLIGQQAVVKRAVGLGGWHHCVLADGSEIKLQRNALQILEMGPPELDDLTQGSSSDTEGREPRLEILTQPRIRRPPKTMAHSDMAMFKKAEASNSSGLRSTTYSLVDLHKLETTSLKRYRRAFHLGGVDAAAPKADLLTAVQQHFTTQEVDEQEVLCELVCALRRRHKRQQLLAPQQYSSSDCDADPYSSYYCGENLFACQQQQQQLTQMILLQQQYVYMGPRIFQGQQQQQQQQQ